MSPEKLKEEKFNLEASIHRHIKEQCEAFREKTGFDVTEVDIDIVRYPIVGPSEYQSETFVANVNVKVEL